MLCYSVPSGFVCARGGRSAARTTLALTYENCGHGRRVDVGPFPNVKAFVGMTALCKECGVDRRVAAAVIATRT